ncbi:esterase family protein, partial [Burkholderia multivorans]
MKLMRVCWLLLLLAAAGPARAFHTRTVAIPSAAMRATLA